MITSLCFGLIEFYVKQFLSIQ